ncbi:MAG: hypothetical protein KatS3mg022_1162 [Armatimonadota bacterium]|nr:MAG: hypothetical protein KatS3mg022_1162 [Armatimonadota bacterium]
MTGLFRTAGIAAVAFACVTMAQAQEQGPKPVPRPPSIARKDMNLPPGAQVPSSAKKSKPSPKEKALAAQLQQLEKQRDALINKSAELDRKRLSTQDPEERKRLDREKLALLQQLDKVVARREVVYRAWQKAAMERWRRENPEAFQTPPGMPPGMPPQIIAKQIEIAQEQLAKLKKQGKPDTDPQVKMYKERIERYKQMLKASAAKPPTSPTPKPATPEK